MTLLLLFAYTPLAPSVPISELVQTAPLSGVGYPIQRPATSGEWRIGLELADPTAGDSVVWHDVTRFYAGDVYQRGADDYLGKYRAAVAQVQLQTDNDDLAPWGQDTTDLFGTNITLDGGLLMRLTLFRVVASVTVEWTPIWTGRVETWGDASAARGQIRTHVVTVTDTIADLANVPTAIDTNGLEWDDYIADNLNGAYWLFGADYYGDTDSGALLIDLTPTAAIARMDYATESFGLVWRSRRDGRLIVHPAPWDTLNVNRWPNPLLDVYPSGLIFSYSPDFTDIEYIDDDDQQSFGIQRTSLGVLNSFLITYLDDFAVPTLYAIDDPVSMSRYGVRPFTTSWVQGGASLSVADEMLAARAYSSSQALPLRTTLDHEGFWSAMSLIDQFDPVTVIHATSDTGPVVTATGTVRNVTEARTVRGEAGGDYSLSWQSTVQVDIESDEVSPALLPVEDLAFVSSASPGTGGPASAEFTWTNPTQPDVTPTEVQFRVLGRSLIWFSEDYPGVGADGTTINWLDPGTYYTLQVRLIRRVNGSVVAASAIRSVRFFTPNRIFPIPIPGTDPGDTDVIGDPPDDCDDFQIDLQENDGTTTPYEDGWTTVDTFTGAELHDNGDGTYSLTTPIPNSFFNDGSMYRFRSSCDGIDWIAGTSFDPPDDWDDPCTTPPALSDPPFDDPSLLVYVPAVCAPDVIKEYVSGIVAVHGDALDSIVTGLADPDEHALLALPDPAWSDAAGGILAYGECPQVVGVTGDKTITIRVNIADPTTCVLGECAAMRITCTEVTGTTWRPGVTVYKTGSTISLAGSTALPFGTYTITATHELATGDIKLYVDDVFDNSVGGTDNVPTINTLPIWRVGAPPESWVTDFAVFDDTAPPEPTLPAAIVALGPAGYWKFDDASTTILDYSGNARNGTATGLALQDQAGADGVLYARYNSDGDKVEMADAAAWSIDNSGTGLTIGYLIRFDSTPASNVVYKGIFPSCEWRVQTGTTNLTSDTLTAANSQIRGGSTNAGFTTGVWYAVLVVWPNATTANQVQMYVNGVTESVAHGGPGGVYTNGTSILGWGNNANGGGSDAAPRAVIAHGFILPYAADATARAAFFDAADADGWF